jgi:hypothetical protein
VLRTQPLRLNRNVEVGRAFELWRFSCVGIQPGFSAVCTVILASLRCSHQYHEVADLQCANGWLHSPKLRRGWVPEPLGNYFWRVEPHVNALQISYWVALTAAKNSLFHRAGLVFLK